MPATAPNATPKSHAIFILSPLRTTTSILYALGGLFFLHSGILVPGLIGAGIAIISATTYASFELDLTAEQFRFVSNFCGLALGTWKTLPPVKQVVVRYFSEFIVTGNGVRQQTDALTRYIVMLSIPPSTEGIIVHRTDKENAIRLAGFLADVLHVQVQLYK